MRALYRTNGTEFYKIKEASAVVVGQTPSFFDNGFIKSVSLTEGAKRDILKLKVCKAKEFRKAFKEVISKTKI